MNAIDDAADRLRGRWIKHVQEDADGNVCIIGAMKAVTGIRSLSALVATPEYQAIDEVSRAETGVWAADFNDRTATSEEDVLRLFKLASYLFDERVSS